MTPNKYHLFLLFLFLSTCSTFNENLDQLSDTINIDLPLNEIETNLAIVNLKVDQNTFDSMYQQPSKEIEIEAFFELYRSKQLVISEELVELELKGNYSKAFSLSSIGVKFDKKYNNRSRKLINPTVVLPHHNLDKIKAIRLRNSGNDFKQTMLKDLSYTQLAIEAGLDLEVAYGEPALVFVNELFLGLLNLRTEANTNGMAGLNDVSKSDITLAKISNPALVKKDGDFDRIDALAEAITAKDIEYLKSEIDLDNFIDYMVFQSYIANVDWPYTNVRFYAVEDQKFRFVLFDLDVVNWVDINRKPLSFIEGNKENMISELFFAFYEEEDFQEQFWDRYKTLLNNGDINHEKFKTIVQNNFENIRTAMPLQIKKYGQPESMMEWQIAVDKLGHMFEVREKKVKNMVN